MTLQTKTKPDHLSSLIKTYIYTYTGSVIQDGHNQFLVKRVRIKMSQG